LRPIKKAPPRGRQFLFFKLSTTGGAYHRVPGYFYSLKNTFLFLSALLISIKVAAFYPDTFVLLNIFWWATFTVILPLVGFFIS